MGSTSGLSATPAAVAVKVPDSIEDAPAIDLATIMAAVPSAAPLRTTAAAPAPAVVAAQNTDTIVAQAPASAPAAAPAVTAQTQAVAVHAISKLRQSIIDGVKANGQLPLVQKIAASISTKDQFALTAYGTDAQKEVSAVATKMLEGVRTSAAGDAGEALLKLNSQMKGFDMKIHEQVGGVFNWFKGKSDIVKAAISEFQARERTVNGQLDKMSDDLFDRKTKLSEAIGQLEDQFNASVKALGATDMYIAAATLRLEEIDTKVIPELQKQVAADPDNQKLSQELQDTIATSTKLDRRIGELCKTRIFLGQQLPTIRTMQQTNDQLVGQIETVINETIGIWRMLIAQTVTVQYGKDNADVIKAVADNTNDMLAASAKNLHQTAVQVAQQTEAGIISYDALNQRNEELIATIQEVADIAKEARQKRVDSENGLEESRKKLQQVLEQVSA